MLRIYKNTWVFFIFYLILIFVLRLNISSQISEINRIAINSFMSLILIGLFVRSHLVMFSLQPNTKIINWKYLLPITAILLIFSITNSDFLLLHNMEIEFLIYVLIVAFAQTLTEELIFRGILLNAILRNTKNLIRAVLLSAIIFGVAHFLSLMNSNELDSVINQVIVATMAGIFLGAIFVSCRNIYYVAFLHLLINIPAYINRKIQNNIEIENVIETNSNNVDMFISSIMMFLMYSPLLIIGLFILIKANKEFKMSNQKVKTENSFSFNKN